MKGESEITNLGLLRYFFGHRTEANKKWNFYLSIKVSAEILERFKMQNNKPTPTPTVMGLKLSRENCSTNVNPTLYKSMIGSLMYLTGTRPDMMYAASLVSRFMETHKETHWHVAKMILRYVNGTKQ